MTVLAHTAPRPYLRQLAAYAIGLFAALALFWLMQTMIYMPEGELGLERRVDDVSTVSMDRPDDKPPEAVQPLQDEPPPPPAAPATLRTDLPVVKLPVLDVSTVAGPIQLSTSSSLGTSGLSLGSSGVFGGFALGGGTGGGFGKGEGFKGKDLVPLSTARPQIPEFACKQGIEGWTEVVFTVMPNGRVQDVKIIDSKPRGVFEAAAVESISNWIYEQHPRARQVKQRNEYKLADCQYNWR